MSLYSRALKHVDMKRVKKLHEQKLEENNNLKRLQEERLEYLRNLCSPEFSNWRYDLQEGPTMSSAGMFTATLPGQGDTDLVVTSLDASSYDVGGDVSFSNGTDDGFTGGFSSSDGIINIGGENSYSSGFVSDNFDFSAVDTINITAIAGNNSNGGMLPTRSLNVYFATTDDASDAIEVIPTSASSFRNVNITIPEKFRTSDVFLIFDTNTSDGHGYHGRHFINQTIPISGLDDATIGNLFPDSPFETAGNNISFYLRTNRNSQTDYRNLGFETWWNSMAQRYGWFNNVGTDENPELEYITWPAAPVSGATIEPDVTDEDYTYIGRTIYNYFKGTKLYGISNISFRRRRPMNVLVSLDSPEATAFIRDSPTLSNLSPQERLKKLKKMLEAGDEYVAKMLGYNFPGTGAVPPGEYDPFAQAPPGEAGTTPGVELTDVPMTSTQQLSQQKAISNNQEVSNAAEKLGTAGKTYLDYLTNNLPDIIDNNYLGQKYVNSVFKNAQINSQGTVSVGDNIVGTGGKATYDPGTNRVSIPFNYDFKTNDQEFSDPSKAGRVNDFQKAVLNAVGPYSADAQPNLPPALAPVQSLAGIVFGGAIGASKALGGAQSKKGNVSMDADELKRINPKLHKQLVKEEVLTEKKKLKSVKDIANKIPGYYDGKPSPLGFPEEEPPKMVNGYHPDLVDGKKVAQRFNRLDPISAKAMPPTGNPHIDKKVRAAAKKPK